MLLFSIHFRYDDEIEFRPYVLNCDFSRLSYFFTKVSSLACVAQINVDIFKPDPMIVYNFKEYTI